MIALEDSSGTVAGYAVLLRPLIATFVQFPTCRLVVPRSEAFNADHEVLVPAQGRTKIDVVLEVRCDRAQISGMFPGVRRLPDQAEENKADRNVGVLFIPIRSCRRDGGILLLENAEAILRGGKLACEVSCKSPSRS